MQVIDPAARKEELEKLKRWATVVRKHGGRFVVLAPNGVKREGYTFQEHRANIVAALNDYAMAVNDLGLGAGLHQHTGTAVESRDETYAIMEAANTKHLKFAPDVGQLQKGGANAAQVVKDFLPITVHMHLKDFIGGEHFAGYCPLGQGKVDLQGDPRHGRRRQPERQHHGRARRVGRHAVHRAGNGANQQVVSGEARIQVPNELTSLGCQAPRPP